MGGYILKGRVIDGNGGAPIAHGVVVTEDGKITHVCPESDFRTDADLPVIEIENGTIMPGLIDCHTHLASIGLMPAEIFMKPKYDSFLETVRDARALLMAGFTSAREMGEFGPYLKRGIAKGLIPGPKLFVGSKLISSTGGHGDICTQLDWDYVQKQHTTSRLADGVDECLKAVRMNFREGADFIKTCSTGGVFSSGDEIDSIEYSMPELRVMVEEAERHGTYVASHSIGTQGIRNALEAGVKSIEHGVFLDDYCIELMVKNDCTHCPTQSILHIVVENLGEVPEHVARKAQEAVQGYVNSVQLSKKAGVRIVFGTDYLGGESDLMAFGKQGREFIALTDAGLTPMEAIQAATKNASHVIKKEKEVGTLERGKTADVIIVDGNPLEDISILANPENVRIILQDGLIVKQ
ncbi:MAG: amidohydrolase family protein [Oscillospiraceae bacterium]|nr:amidohydrolase family protein [Oscillospiraceae bacterium]